MKWPVHDARKTVKHQHSNGWLIGREPSLFGPLLPVSNLRPSSGPPPALLSAIALFFLFAKRYSITNSFELVVIVVLAVTGIPMNENE